MDAHPNRFKPLPLAPTLTLAHRVVVPAMASETADGQGMTTPATLAHYARLAEARPSLLLVEYTFVHPTGRSEPNQLGATTDAHVPGLRAIADIITRSGSVPGLQLTHAGGKSQRSLTGGPLHSPSGVPVPVKDRVLEKPDEMTRADLTTWRDAFVAAARRGAKAGFQVLELHAAHGYGFNQWISPITNLRTDEYGGDLAGRMRLLLEVIAGIQRAVPAVVLSVRIPGQDHLPGGFSSDDAVELARRLVAAGVAIINVSSGLGGWRRPADRQGEGYLVSEAAKIQAAVTAPVIGVGGIQSAAYIEECLSERRLALAAVGRAILLDPSGWRQKNMTGDDHGFH